MKLNSAILLTRLGALALALVGSTSVLQSASTSPVGDWDFLIQSGREHGVAQITFFGDGTLTGVEVTSALPTSTRIDPRTGLVGSGSSSTNQVNFGGATLSGIWTTNRAGKVIGLIDESSVVITATTNTAVTNTLNFTGTVRGSHMTMIANDLVGRTLFRGVPAAVVPDLSGTYYATVRINGVNHFEFFTLAPNGANPNLYDLSGNGPAGVSQVGTVPLIGTVLASIQKQATALISQIDSNGTAVTLTAVSGSANFTRGSWRLSGTDLNGSHISYQAQKQ